MFISSCENSNTFENASFVKFIATAANAGEEKLDQIEFCE